MKLLITILMLFCQGVQADNPWITKSEALSVVKSHLDVPSTDSILIGEMYLAYPYGYGVPAYIGYFSMTEDQDSEILGIKVNALTEELAVFYQKKDENPTIIKEFLDTSFVKSKVQEKDIGNRKVALMQFMTCRGEYPFFDCLDVASPFWRVHFDDGEEYVFYYASKDWRLLSVVELKRQLIKYL